MKIKFMDERTGEIKHALTAEIVIVELDDGRVFEVKDASRRGLLLWQAIQPDNTGAIASNRIPLRGYLWKGWDRL